MKVDRSCAVFYLDYETLWESSALGRIGLLTCEFHRENPFGGWGSNSAQRARSRYYTNKGKMLGKTTMWFWRHRTRAIISAVIWGVTNLQAKISVPMGLRITVGGEKGMILMWVDVISGRRICTERGQRIILIKLWHATKCILAKWHRIHEFDTKGILQVIFSTSKTPFDLPRK